MRLAGAAEHRLGGKFLRESRIVFRNRSTREWTRHQRVHANSLRTQFGGKMARQLQQRPPSRARNAAGLPVRAWHKCAHRAPTAAYIEAMLTMLASPVAAAAARKAGKAARTDSNAAVTLEL